jgi:hypothetical protein
MSDTHTLEMTLRSIETLLGRIADALEAFVELADEQATREAEQAPAELDSQPA